jgi:indole-3-glycerol phosphate synthase
MILDEITAATRKRVAARKLRYSESLLEAEAHALCAGVSTLPVLPGLPSPSPQMGSRFFEYAISGPGVSFICELKRSSPSKGVIADDFPYIKIAKEYEEAGAAAISVLTEPDFFGGSDAYLREVAEKVAVPVLRKDFTVDPYQIYEAKVLGASAILLICAILDKKTLSEFIKNACTLGLASIVETHNESEVDEALEIGARIVGVNNRDLATFEVDLGLSLRLRPRVPENVLFVAESGIKSADDVKALSDGGVDAALIGEALMRSPDKKTYLQTLRQYA